MAENLLNSAASSVIGELTRSLFSGLLGKLERKDAAAADKKLRRLDMLLIKINSAVEASEKHAIKNASLVKWRDRLKKAAAEGGEVLASFRQREVDAAAAQAQATSDGDDAQAQAQQNQHQHQQDPSSSSSSSSTTASATATKTLLFSSEEDMERLNNAVEVLEDLSSDIRVFIKLLKLEILAPAPAPFAEDIIRLKRSRGSYGCCNTGEGPPLLKTSKMCPLPKLEGTGQIRMGPTAAATAQAAGEGSTLLDRLEKAVATICRIVELADGRDLSGYEWLACWASVFREAKWQGCAVLGAISTVDEVEVARCADQEDFELGRFVRNMESLAWEAGSFSDLACLCPTARCTG